MDQFLNTTSATLLAILKIFLVVFLAGFLVRRKVITDAMVTALTQATIVLFLPCLILDKILTNLSPAEFPLWWTLPLVSIAMALAGLALATVVFFPDLPAKRSMLAVASMQNAGYLVLPVGAALYPAQFDEFALYVSLFIVGFNPILWSIGKFLATSGASRPADWRGLLNPPLVACLSSIALVLTGLSRLIPTPVLETIELVGQGAVPVATVVLGAMLGGMSLRLRPHLWDAVRAMTVKYGLLPALTVAALSITNLGATNPLLARFLVLEAASAPAVGLILQVRAYGGDEQKVGTVMLLSYILCGLALPVWLAVWEMVAAG
jgi:predicted permease